MENNNQGSLGKPIVQFIILKGVFLLITGAVLLIFPNATLATLVFIMGFYWLIDGLSIVIRSINGRKVNKKWGWGIFTGLLGVAAGVVVLSKPMLSAVLTTSFLMWFLGISAFIYGLSGILTGYRLPSSPGKTSMIYGGIFSVLFGVILMSSPYMAAITIIYTMGVISIIGGISILVVASKLKKKLKNIN